MKPTFIRTSVAVVAAAGCVAAMASAAQADPPNSATSYVSPSGGGSNQDTSCADAGFATIGAAVAAAPAGGTVVVCAGTYTESVTVDRQLTLQGMPGAVIDATGAPYGVGLAASYSTVTGLTVKNAQADEATSAPGDGIVTGGFVNGSPVPSDHDVIVGNVTTANGGSGIDVNSSNSTVVSGNNASDNIGVGINVSDDLGGPSSHNWISGNVTNRNGGGCGIALADHSGAGVFNNVVIGNTSNRNGLSTPTAPDASAGSGIILADPTPNGGVYNNKIEGNRMVQNGHGGFAMHVHAPGPNFSGNVIRDNVIGKNNLRTDAGDKRTTGIYLGDVLKLTITISDNIIKNDQVGVFAAGPITVKGLHSNEFRHVKHQLVHTAKYAGAGG